MSSRENRVISNKGTVLKAPLDLLSEERWDEGKTRTPRIAVLKIECIENLILIEKCVEDHLLKITRDEIKTRNSRMALLSTDCDESLHLVLLLMRNQLKNNVQNQHEMKGRHEAQDWWRSNLTMLRISTPLQAGKKSVKCGKKNLFKVSATCLPSYPFLYPAARLLPRPRIPRTLR